MSEGVGTARIADAVIFGIEGAAFATWAARVPAVRSSLGLSAGDIGIALLGLACGSIVGLTTSGILVSRLGSRLVVQIGLCVYCVTLPLVAFTGGIVGLSGALAVFGLGKGLMDVAANVQGLQIQRSYPGQIMGSFHALFSGGGLVGAAVGAVAADMDVPVRVHFPLVCAVLLVIGFVASRQLLDADGESENNRTFSVPSQEIAGFGMIAFCALLIEGVASDWSAVFLRTVAGADAGVAALGFAMFSLTMTVGRFLTDGIVDRIGPQRFIRLAAVVIATGLALTLIAVPSVTLVGFGLLGIGLAGVIPVVFSMAGTHSPDVSSGSAIAAVSTAGYGGFVVGPVVIGTIGEFATLRTAFLPVLGLAIGMAMFSGRLLTTSRNG